MNNVSEKEQNLWLTLSGVFDNIPAEIVAETLLAEGFDLEDIRQTYFAVVAPALSLLHMTDKNRQEPFIRNDILEACFQFYRPRLIRPLVRLFGNHMCRRAGKVMARWESLENELRRQGVHAMPA